MTQLLYQPQLSSPGTSSVLVTFHLIYAVSSFYFLKTRADLGIK